MGEFPEPAIRGSTVAESTPAIESTGPSQPIQAADPSSSVDSSSSSETRTSLAPSSAPATPKATTSFSHAPSTRRSSTIESLAPTTSSPPPTTSSIQSISTTQQTSTPIPQSASSQVFTSITVTSSLPTIPQPISTLVSTTIEIHADLETSSPSEIVTRPIITPTPTQPAPLATTAPTANSHLSLGAIFGIVAVIFVVLVVTGACIVLGPRRALRKVGIGANRDKENDYDGWERGHPESGTWSRRSASIGASSDWRPPPPPFPTRPSTVSMGGPGMAGVGAGKSMGLDNSAPATPRRMSQGRVEERGAVRSGWFAASMVRGASLLSLGSLVRPLTDSSNGRSSERMSRMGTGGSAGKRFQELYRRERASGSPVKPNRPTEYLATVNEMGEHSPGRAVPRQGPGEIGGYRPRSMEPRVRRPSRLATSHVPEIVVQDATLPNLSSVSSVTHESGGRGYDADAEAERRPRVF